MPQLPGSRGELRHARRSAPGRALFVVHVDYGRDFERNVELTFAPAKTVRPLPVGNFCISGPLATQHVAVQVLLSPGERRTVAVDLPPGSYRLRTLHPGGVVDLEYESGAFPGLCITESGVELLPAVGRNDEPGSVTFVNKAGYELAALIEERTWTRDALVAPEVISLQAFRDLFAEATLRPGDDAGVTQVALLFTDLRGSTALYERVGDATAYNLVRDTSRCSRRSCANTTARWSRRSATR